MKNDFRRSCVQRIASSMILVVSMVACNGQTINSMLYGEQAVTVTHYDAKPSDLNCQPPAGMSHEQAIAVPEQTEWFPGECVNGRDCIAGGFQEKGCGTIVELEAPDGTKATAYVGNICPAIDNPKCEKGGDHFDLPQGIFEDLGLEGKDNRGGNNGGPDTRVIVRRKG